MHKLVRSGVKVKYKKVCDSFNGRDLTNNHFRGATVFLRKGQLNVNTDGNETDNIEKSKTTPRTSQVNTEKDEDKRCSEQIQN